MSVKVVLGEKEELCETVSSCVVLLDAVLDIVGVSLGVALRESDEAWLKVELSEGVSICVELGVKYCESVGV